MSAEAPIPSSLEAKVRVIGSDHPANRAAVQVISVIEKSLVEKRGSIDFTLFPFVSPFFETNPLSGGMGGLNTDIAFLDKKEGKETYRERNLSLKFGMGDVSDPGKFLNALGAKTVKQIVFSFKATSNNIMEDPDERIVLQGVKVTSWEEGTVTETSIMH